MMNPEVAQKKTLKQQKQSKIGKQFMPGKD